MSPTNNNTTAVRPIIRTIGFDGKRTPAEAAKISTKKAVESLHKSQQRQIETYIDKIITLLNLISKNDESKKRMEVPAFVP
jgi:hypothetical protein